jgi:MFS transporter, DHA1 family, multidrug resistance protein
MWKRNLAVLWFSTFFIMAGMNMIIPFLPLYVQELGVTDIHAAALWSGIIFAGAPLLSGLLAPFWGGIADRYGRKVMLIRSGIGMSVTMALMGYAHSPMELLLLRLLMGTISGFLPTAIALQATETPKEHAGRALGTLQTGQVAGSLIGPLIGGILAEWIGIRNVFYFTGTCLFIAALVVIFGVHETKVYQPVTLQSFFHKKEKKPKTTKEPAGYDFRELYPLFLTSFLLFYAINSIEPVITVYVQSLNVKSHLETVSGIVFASSGIGTILAAPFLGKLGDKIGNRKVLVYSLCMMVLFTIPQAWIYNVWAIIGLRFLAGVFVGGLAPSVNALLRKLSPAAVQGQVFGYSQRASAIGMVAGSVSGGFIASHFGISTIFYFTGLLFLCNLLLVRKNIKEKEEYRNIKQA